MVFRGRLLAKESALFVPRNGPVATVDGLRDGVVKPLCFEGWEIQGRPRAIGKRKRHWAPSLPLTPHRIAPDVPLSLLGILVSKP